VCPFFIIGAFFITSQAARQLLRFLIRFKDTWPTLRAAKRVNTRLAMYTQVATILPLSNIFDSCFKGPIRNMVLRDAIITQLLMSRYASSAGWSTVDRSRHTAVKAVDKEKAALEFTMRNPKKKRRTWGTGGHIMQTKIVILGA